MPVTGDEAVNTIALLVKSSHALLFFECGEDARAFSALKAAGAALRLPLFVWTHTKGLRRDPDTEQPAPQAERADGQPQDPNALGIYGTANLPTALDHVEHTQYPAIYVFFGAQASLKDETQTARIKDAAKRFETAPGILVFVTQPGFTEIEPGLLNSGTRFELPPPSEREYADLLRRVLAEMSGRGPVKVELAGADLTVLVRHLKGLSLAEARRLITRAVVEDGVLSASDLRYVLEAKKEAVEKEGVLEYFPIQDSFEAVAGLSGLKSWLAKRREFFSKPADAAAFGLSCPKGILLVGVQGCGKSLCARAVAADWRLPLLRLDPSRLYDKYIGETEKNFLRAMKTAERLAPVVLWVDEIEKAFASSSQSDDGGVSMRVLGSFLSWLADRKGDVFVVATANQIEMLPPEFVRKGRFDEIFFVDLPSVAARAKLFAVHLLKRGRKPEEFDMAALSAASVNFSGAEIEQSVVAALYTAFSLRAPLTQAVLLQELGKTRPLAVTMAGKVQAIRDWARGRTVLAD